MKSISLQGNTGKGGERQRIPSRNPRRCCMLGNLFSLGLGLFGKRNYEIDPTVSIGRATQIYGEGRIRVGKGSHIGSWSFLHAAAGHSISVGEDCAISHTVYITTDRRSRLDLVSDADVVIGNRVWIGFGVFVRGGVKIGDDAIIGANSVVTRDIPPKVVAGGVPARVLKEIA
jgi:maltose O-acetyltransferase